MLLQFRDKFPTDDTRASLGNSNEDYDMNNTFQDFMDFHGDLRCENCTIIAGIEVQCTDCLSNTTDWGDEDDCSIEIETQGLGA